jgi:hypothetical protein
MRNISFNVFVSLRSEALGVEWSKDYFERLITKDSNRVLLSGLIDKLAGKVSLDYFTYYYATGVFSGEKEPSAVLMFLRSEHPNFKNDLKLEVLFMIFLALRLTRYLGQMSVLVEINFEGTIVYIEVSNFIVKWIKDYYDKFISEELDPRFWVEKVIKYFDIYELRRSDVKRNLVRGLFPEPVSRR